MYTRVFAMGRPMAIVDCVVEIGCTVDQMVVSVGPYIFHRQPQRSVKDSANARGNDSPPQRILSSGEPSHPASSSNRHVAGVAWTTEARLFAKASWSRVPLAPTARLTRTIRAPTVSGRKSSSPAISKDRVVNAKRV